MKMKKEKKNKKYIALGIILFIVGAVMIWFHIPYSPTKSDFRQKINNLVSDNKIQADGKLFSEEDFSVLPYPIQEYLKYCGYIGTPEMSYMKIEFKDVDFMQGKNGPALTIDYTQYNFADKPARMALIDSSMFGIPFEGFDYYQDGIGGMKGVIAKSITLFDQKGTDMDKACLATFLAESLFEPSVLLQDYISFEQINDFEVKATITYKNQTASGIFKFNEQYEMVSFATNDRAATNSDGTMEYIPWTARCSDYKVSENGIKHPQKMQAVWNYDDGDFIYFDGVISKLSYNYEK